MAETINMEKMYKEILALKKELQTIKSYMINTEFIMTPEEEIQLKETLEKHKEGETKRYEDLRKELGD